MVYISYFEASFLLLHLLFLINHILRLFVCLFVIHFNLLDLACIFNLGYKFYTSTSRYAGIYIFHFFKYIFLFLFSSKIRNLFKINKRLQVEFSSKCFIDFNFTDKVDVCHSTEFTDPPDFIIEFSESSNNQTKHLLKTIKNLQNNHVKLKK